MFALLLALAGAFTVTRVVAAQKAPSVPGNIPPEGTIVVCPSEISPGNYGEWATPCDVQTYSGPTPPEPWGGAGCSGVDADGKSTNVCRILPDGTPLYQYAVDGVSYSDRQPGVYQTFFAGVPLDVPPLLETGGAGWTPGTSSNPIMAKGVAASDISSSPAPFAWHAPSTSSAGFRDPATGHAYPQQLVGGKFVSKELEPYYRPQWGIPYRPKPWRIGDPLAFINSIQKFACNALGTGLTVSSGLLSSEVASGLVPGGKSAVNAANKVATGFYNSICAE